MISLLFAAFAVSVSAQTPPYQGALMLQTGSLASKCLRADNVNGAPVVISDCTGGPDQQWTFTNGQVHIYGNKCLDVINGVNADGTKLQIYDCEIPIAANQQFFYTPYGDNHLQWTNQGKCLDITNGNYTNGNQVMVWTCSGVANQVWNTGYVYNQLPAQSEPGQSGTNACGTDSSPSSLCQTMYLNEADDFCLWAPPNPNSAIGDTERDEVAWCTKSGRGTRVIPDGTLSGVHFVRTGDYVQITGAGDFTKINVLKGDGGGELDPHGADSNGNPIGGLIFGNTFGPNLQYHEWTQFISDSEFCFRACVGPNARANCQHIYDEMGCYWNMPANYDPGVFESCQGDDDLPMGVYGTSTWSQGISPTPDAHPAASSSSCTNFASITVSPANQKREVNVGRFAKRAPEPAVTPAPLT